MLVDSTARFFSPVISVLRRVICASRGSGFYGIGVAGQQVILSAGDNGAWELVGNRASQVKQQPMVGGFNGGSDMALFVEPGNEEEPSLIEFAPNLTPDWWRRWFPPFD